MTFELWTFTDHVSECFARRSQDQVHSVYFDMKIGEQRHIRDDDWIVRVS